ncbi:MAG: hypothetical protein JXQ66_07330 [Campylobacterales bacterium]|nr:hypothetical protein [Campylobacterales bacterium]
MFDTIYNIAESLTQKRLLKKLLDEKREAELKERERETMLTFTEAYSLPMVIFDGDKLLHYSSFFEKLFDDTKDFEKLTLDMENLFDEKKGYLNSFRDFNPKNYEFNKVQITDDVGKKIFRIYKKDISYFGKNAQMYMFVNITYEEYLKVKSKAYMEFLERMVVREKVKNNSSLAFNDSSNQTIISDTKVAKESDSITQNMLRKKHKDEEINAVDFLDTINPMYITDLQELDDLDKDLADALFELEDGVSLKLQESAKYFSIYADNIYFLEEFRDIYVVIKNLATILNELDFDEIAEDKKVTFILYLNSIREDLAYWRKSVFIDQNAPNIHYLDSSLLSSCLQVESLLSNVDDAEVEDYSDLEFF